MMVSVIFLAVFGRWYLGRENKKRNVMYGAPRRDHALEDLTDRENKDFRYLL